MTFPGFDGLRLLAAFGVLLSHAFLIAAGENPADALVRGLGKAGYWGVHTFFIISRFLLARSLEREPDALRFAVNRALRIYPGLLACVLFTALVIGPLASALPWRDYLVHADVPGYVLQTMNCLCAKGWLPGVFGYAEPAELQSIVNGSLWSLSYEVLSYLLLLALWLALRRIAVVALVLVGLALATLALPAVHALFAGIAFTLPYFAGGVAMHLVVRRFGLHGALAAACALVLAIAASFDAVGAVYASAGAYLVVWLGARPNPLSRLAARHGDLSYGVYLYAWPLQQLILQFTGSRDPWLMLALSAPAAALLAYASYRFVEAPALRLKGPVLSALRPAAGGRAGGAWSGAAGGAAAAACLLATAVVLFAPGALWWFVSASLAGVALASAAGAGLGTAWRRAARARA